MATLWGSGFEQNSTAANVEWTTVTNGTIVTSTVRSGTYSGEITSLVSATARGFEYQFLSAAGTGPYFLRAYINVATLPSAANTIITLNNGTGLVGTPEASIKLDNTGAFTLFNTTVTQVGSASSTITTGTWHSLEIWFDSTGGVGAGILKARLDGVQFAASTALTIAAGVRTFTLGGNLAAEVQTTGDWFFDDVRINDGTGGSQNTYCGEEKMIQLRPNAAGDAAQFSVVAGGSANFNRVNEFPPDGATTTNGDSVLNVTDMFAMDDSGIGANDIVNVVMMGGNHKNNTADPVAGFKYQVEKTSAGTKSQSAEIIPNNGAFTTNAAAAPRNYPLVTYTDPDGAAWTKTTLDSMQAGYIISTQGTNRIIVTTIWVLVGYTPAATTNTSNFFHFFPLQR